MEKEKKPISEVLERAGIRGDCLHALHSFKKPSPWRESPNVQGKVVLLATEEKEKASSLVKRTKDQSISSELLQVCINTLTFDVRARENLNRDSINCVKFKQNLQEDRIKIGAVLLSGMNLVVCGDFGKERKALKYSLVTQKFSEMEIFKNMQVLDLKAIGEYMLAADGITKLIKIFNNKGFVTEMKRTFLIKDIKNCYDKCSNIIFTSGMHFAYVSNDSKDQSADINSLIHLCKVSKGGIEEIATISGLTASVTQLALRNQFIYVADMGRPVLKIPFSDHATHTISQQNVEKTSLTTKDHTPIYNYKSICPFDGYVAASGTCVKELHSLSFTLFKDNDLSIVNTIVVKAKMGCFWVNKLEYKQIGSKKLLLGHCLRSVVIIVYLYKDPKSSELKLGDHLVKEVPQAGYILGSFPLNNYTHKQILYGYDTLTILSFRDILSL